MTGADPEMVARIRGNLDAYTADHKARVPDAVFGQHAARLAVNVDELLDLVERLTRPAEARAHADAGQSDGGWVSGTGWPVTR